MIEVKIKPTRVLFYDEDNSFGIFSADVNPDDISKVEINKYGNISIKGRMPKLEIGMEYDVKIAPDHSSQYKGSYTLQYLKSNRPTTITEQKMFLSTILTPTQVNNIYEVYSEEDDVIGMIENGKFDFTKVKGIAEKTFEKLKKKVLDNIDMSEIFTFMNKYGLKYNMLAKLIKEYENPQIVIDKINQNPYVLTEVSGVGFKKADEIAKAVGYNMTSPHRIASALYYILGEESASGHSWIAYKPLLNKAVDLLNIDKKHIEDVLNNNPKGIVRTDERYALERVYEAEEYIALRMTEIKTHSNKVFEAKEIDDFLNDYCREHNVELEENQRQFFHDWNENSIMMLIGGGGMGKSWLQQILLKLIKKKSMSIALLAPTGRASKVMTNYTGIPASTIHRRVKSYGEDDESVMGTILEDVVIVDEASMCDVFILKKMFYALRNENVRLLFVGDDFQLPSVGVGNFLYDVIHSGHIKVCRLKKVFRQSDGGILNVSTDVRENHKFIDSNAEGRIIYGKDCVFWMTNSDYVRDGVLHNYKKVIKKFNQDDVVVLTPTNKGSLGTRELNKQIQKIANPASPAKKERKVGKKDDQITFRVGDSVMNLVNTYDIDTVNGGKADIFNGDTGKIVDIDESGKVFIIDFDDILVKVKFGVVLTNLTHSWASTIHKSQGGQYKVVIVVCDKSATFQLNANLLYTGFSRAQEYMLVLGQPTTINKAMDKFANMERRSFLQEMLDKFNGGEEGYNNSPKTSLEEV
ncbi:AAA family ATPase [Bacillus mojavensis]